MCSCLLFLYVHLHYPVAAQMDSLRISMKSSMSSRPRSPVSCLWRTSACVYFSAVSYLNVCLVETFSHVITV
jgi:hypothetical protein